MNIEKLKQLAKLIRYYILQSTTAAGSGHPTSSLSAADLMTVLMYAGPARNASSIPASNAFRSNAGWADAGGFFRFDFANPDSPGNDRLVFSKGHASPLFYALYLAGGVITPTEIMTLRKFDSRLEGHPTPRFPFTEAATGSLGQGLSVGVGLAMAQRKLLSVFSSQLSVVSKSDNRLAVRQDTENRQLKTDNRIPHTFVLLGDGEMAEGSTWEAINLAFYYKLNNLVAILDVNRLGQSQETMLEWDTGSYEKRFRAFGWDTMVIDGHDYEEIIDAFRKAISDKDTSDGGPERSASWRRVERNSSDGGGNRTRPFVIIAKTVKGKGVSFIENKNGWHGKPLNHDELKLALKELGNVDLKIRGKVAKPESVFRDWSFVFSKNRPKTKDQRPIAYTIGDSVATRKAYGTALARLGATIPNMVVLDAEVKNSTYAEIFKEKYPDKYYEMFIAEQNMVGSAVGFARLGFMPFVSTFACFLTRAYDQFRMAALSNANIKVCGSHAGVSIGEDGPSQMGLEDLAMFKSLHGSTVLYPADAVATEKLVFEMAKTKGISYIRTTRPTTPVIYGNDEEFPVGGCKIHRLTRQPKNTSDGGPERSASWRRVERDSSEVVGSKRIVIIAAGITLFEALKAQAQLAKEGIETTVIDCYSIKPIDGVTLRKLANSRPGLEATVITVEDHWFEGGLGDAVLNVFSNDPKVKVHKLAVTKMPRSGKPAELMEYEGIDSISIVSTVKRLI